MTAPAHGTVSRYNNQRCRCDQCTAANTRRTAEYRARRDTTVVTEIVQVLPNSDDERRRAQLAIASHARDAAECSELLGMLGLRQRLDVAV